MTHAHRCPVDGTIWKHTANSFGDERDHACPRCGRLQWYKHQPAGGGVLLPIALITFGLALIFGSREAA